MLQTPCFHALDAKLSNGVWGYSRKGESSLAQSASELLPYCLGITLGALRRVVNGGDELFCLLSFVHSFIHTFNHHIFTSTICKTKIHKTWMLPSKTPNFENNKISDYETLYYYSFLTVTFSVSVFQIRLSGNWL